MENKITDIRSRTQYNFQWFGIQILFCLVAAIILFAISDALRDFADERCTAKLLSKQNLYLFKNSIYYNFPFYILSLIAVTLIEMKHKANVSFFQRVLMSIAICISYLLTLSFSEFMPYWAAFIISAFMTTCLISWFIMALYRKLAVCILGTSIIAAEYILLMILVYIGARSLIVCSIILFIIVAIMMYCTIKLKKDNNILDN